MRMEMDRQADFFFQGGDQFAGGGGFQQPRHIFQTQNMGPGGFQILAHRHIIFQVVFGAVGIQNIAGVTNCAFAQFVVVQYGIHRDAHVFNPVQAVEHAKDINACFGGLTHKFLHHIIGVIGVSYAV